MRALDRVLGVLSASRLVFPRPASQQSLGSMARSLILVCACAIACFSLPAAAQRFEVQERFDPVLTLDFVTTIVDRANCTPICGNPTCCISFQLRAITHVGDRRFESFRDGVRDTLGYSVSDFAAAAALDDQLYFAYGFSPVTDLDVFSDQAEWLMQEARTRNIFLACRPCCVPCGNTVCCGGCWTFRAAPQ